MFDATVAAGVLQLRHPGTRWLSTGADGGFAVADAAYNVSVPDGWGHEDLPTYVAGRRERAGFDGDGPALLTGVELQHARGARLEPVEVYATAGVSNPAGLPMTPAGAEDAPGHAGAGDGPDGPDADAGTVNLFVGTPRALDDAALANLVAVVAEAKAAALLDRVGVTGTTTDAVVVGTDPHGEPAAFSGSATQVGDAARACVREAVTASFESRYADREVPASVADAEHGVVTDRRAEVFEP
jgi:adenosylcobinamide hydrolase